MQLKLYFFWWQLLDFLTRIQRYDIFFLHLSVYCACLTVIPYLSTRLHTYLIHVGEIVDCESGKFQETRVPSLHRANCHFPTGSKTAASSNERYSLQSSARNGGVLRTQFDEPEVYEASLKVLWEAKTHSWSGYTDDIFALTKWTEVYAVCSR